MSRIINKSQLLRYIAETCMSITVRNTLANFGGKVENFGAFQPAPGSNKPGFVCRVINRFNAQYFIAVTVYDFDNYHCYLPDHIDWSSYVGGNSPLYTGDRPEVYQRFKEAQRIDVLLRSEDKNGKKS